MFTGLIQHRGLVASIDSTAAGAKLVLDASGWEHRPRQGDSIAVNGCCLTVATGGEREGGDSHLAFDVVRQTLDVTSLGLLRAGDPVNLEHAATPATMLGGHIVQGHVDGVAVIEAVAGERDQHRLRIAPPPFLMPYIVDKGSVAIDGVSLTVAAVGEEWFEVALIPTTLALTNLGRLQAGARVNIETDYLAKIVVNYLNRSRGGWE